MFFAQYKRDHFTNMTSITLGVKFLRTSIVLQSRLQFEYQENEVAIRITFQNKKIKMRLYTMI